MSSVTVRLQKAENVYKADVFSESDVYVVIEAIADGVVLASATSEIIRDSKDPVWDSEHTLSGESEWSPKATSIKFTLWDKDMIGSKYLGVAEISMLDFIATPAPELLVHSEDGTPALASPEPHWPTLLYVSLDTGSLPAGWPSQPELTEPESCERHIFMLTRGTRGDVQPFVALARGMAQQRGWQVTICTELRWKSFVLSNAQNVAPGRICYLDSGGDTEKRVNSALGQWATSQTTEFMQMIMLASSESEFFNSATVVMKHLTDLQASSTPVNMMVYGFTLASITLMASEYFKIPCAGFFLQPSSIPSADPNWTAIQPITTRDGLFSFIDSLEEKAFTSQTSLALFKTFTEKNPFNKFNINSIRSWFELPAGDTYTMLKERNSPVVIPMSSSTFDRPADWWDNVITTDFIFLRTGPGGDSELGEPLHSFIQCARTVGAKLALMTFSSMPVSRGTMLQCATRMVKECSFNLRLIYVGKRQEDSVPDALAEEAKALEEEGRFLDVERADFGVLFPFMDIFIVHGGLGTTVEALRMGKPTCVTGPLLMDQRFWGSVCHQKGVGIPATHIDNFAEECLKFVDCALDPTDPEGWQAKAKEQDWGDTADDGVRANVDCFAKLLEAA